MLDGDHYRTAELVNQLMTNAQIKGCLDLIESLKPKFFKEGNQFCFMYGEMPNDCIVGFGDTAHDAMLDFHKNFYSYKAGGAIKV